MEQMSIPVKLGESIVNFTLIKTPASFTGWSFVSLDDKTSPGCPASIFSVALFRSYARLARENAVMARTIERQKALIDRHRKENQNERQSTRVG